MRPLTLAALLLAALLAHAEPIQITGADTLKLWWEPATGPVTGYEAKLVYLDGTESAVRVVGHPPQDFVPRRGMQFSLIVRGCRQADTGLTVCDGPWSEPSSGIMVCPAASDIGCDLVTGASDFIILSHEWGRVSEPTVEDGDE